MPVHGEAIFGTRPWKVFGEGPNLGQEGHFNESKLKYSAQDIRFTRQGDTIYAIVLGWPGDGAEVNIKSLAKAAGVPAIESVTLLGHKGPLTFQQSSEGLRVKLPAAAPARHAVVLKLI
jgi:alpha-L-fucosidase